MLGTGLRLAVMSDLHCHGSSDFDGRSESLLQADSPRIPAGRHPVQALVQLVRGNHLRADALLCPGDLTHKSSNIGLHSGLAYVREIAAELHAPLIFVATGNHDVNSRTPGVDPFRNLKTLHSDFPFSESEAVNRYWSEGFHVAPLSTDVSLAVINTSYHHYSEPESRHGTFPLSQIDALDRHLRSTSAARAHLIALLHHHPVLHSVAGFESDDVIPTGDRLLKCLAQHGCNLVIHGHKHYSRLKRELIDGSHLLVFASGSFSAQLNQIGTHTANLFHIITVDDLAPVATGHLNSWEYNYSTGWHRTSFDGSGLPHVSNFGPPPPAAWLADTLQVIRSSSDVFSTREALTLRLPFLAHCIPSELDALRAELMRCGYEVFHGDHDFVSLVARQ
jgi:3',5'-cyclic AMP phosphodiesterase CpdA